MEYYAAERKEELLPFAIEWMELESIMLRETAKRWKTKITWSYLLVEPNQQNKQMNKIGPDTWN